MAEIQRPLDVLLVEDDVDARLLLEAALDGNGFEGTIASYTDGWSAIEAIDEHGLSGADLAILDLDLPGAHGFEVLAEIRERAARDALPVVVLTNVDDPAIARRAYRLGANCWIRKPARFARLEYAVGAILDFYARPKPTKLHGDGEG